ncbi:hypothetical protein QUA82_27455 [Microcoleus sp. F8-D3]
MKVDAGGQSELTREGFQRWDDLWRAIVPEWLRNSEAVTRRKLAIKTVTK